MRGRVYIGRCVADNRKDVGSERGFVGNDWLMGANELISGDWKVGQRVEFWPAGCGGLVGLKREAS